MLQRVFFIVCGHWNVCFYSSCSDNVLTDFLECQEPNKTKQQKPTKKLKKKSRKTKKFNCFPWSLQLGSVLGHSFSTAGIALILGISPDWKLKAFSGLFSAHASHLGMCIALYTAAFECPNFPKNLIVVSPSVLGLLIPPSIFCPMNLWICSPPCIFYKQYSLVFPPKLQGGRIED